MGKVYETAIKIGASIAKSFKSDTLGAAVALTKLTDASKKLQQAEKSAAAYKKLDEAVRRSKGRYDQASAALRKLEAAEKAAGGATKESTQWRKEGERELAKAAREMDRATKAADRNAASLRKLGVDTSRLASEQRRLAHGVSFSSARERLFGPKKDPKNAIPLMHQAGAQFRGLANDALMIGAAAATAGAAIAGLVMKTIHAGDEIGDTAEKLGIGTTALQELRYGAKISGAETAELDKALGKMLVTVGKFKAAKGKGGAGAGVVLGGVQMLGTGGSEGGSGAGETDPFKRMGLSAKALSSLKPDEQLKKIADGMQKLKTHADKAAVAQAIFGKGAIAILPFLKEGSAGIDKLSAAGHKFGGIMSEEAIKAADEADRALKDAEMAVSGLSATLGSALLPMATKAFGTFSTWVASNRAQIQLWATSAATWITGTAIPAILKIGAEVKSVAAKVLSLVEVGARLTGGFGNLAIAVGALRLVPLVSTLSQIGFQGTKAAISLVQYAVATNAASAAGAAGGVGAMAVTFGSVALAAGAVALAVWRIVDAVKELGGAGAVWQDIKDFVGSGGMMLPSVSKGNAGFAEMQAENQRNLALARARQAAGDGPSAVTSSSSGGGLTVAPQISIAPNVARADVVKGMADATAKTLEAFDKRDAQRRRLAFSEATP